MFLPNLDWNLTSNGRDPERLRSELIDSRAARVDPLISLRPE